MYRTSFAEKSSEKKESVNDLELLPNPSFEELKEAVDYSKMVPYKSDTSILKPVNPGFFPFEWHRGFAKGGGAAYVVCNGKNGILLACKNKTAFYSNTVYTRFPSSETTKRLVGRTLTIKAKVKVLEANGKNTATGKTLSGIMELVQGKDFAPDKGIAELTNYAGIDIIFTGDPADKSTPLIIPAAAKKRKVAFSRSRRRAYSWVIDC